jgi:hypothetical protein
MNLKNLTFDRALNILRVLGAHYIVIDDQGTTHTHGDLRLAEPEKRTRHRTVPVGTYKAVYHPLVKDLQPGGGVSVTLPEGMDAEGFRSSMGAWCGKQWGSGTYLTQIEGRVVELLRVE